MLRIALGFCAGALVAVLIVLASTSWLAPHRCLVLVEANSIRAMAESLDKGWLIDGMYDSDRLICLHQPLLH